MPNYKVLSESNQNTIFNKNTKNSIIELKKV